MHRDGNENTAIAHLYSSYIVCFGGIKFCILMAIRQKLLNLFLNKHMESNRTLDLNQTLSSNEYIIKINMYNVILVFEHKFILFNSRFFEEILYINSTVVIYI